MFCESRSRQGIRLFCGVAAAAIGAFGLTGCVVAPTGACCGADESCRVLTETECIASNGVYQGDNINCDTNSICADEITVFRYTGGACPPEMTIKDGNPSNVECGVPRSRLFDDASPLDGSLADSSTGGFGTFPGVDGPDDTGILVRLDGFAVDTNGLRANIVVICLNIIIPPQAGTRRAVKCRITRGAGFELTPEAEAVVNGGRRNYWAQQARKLAKLEADAAGGVDPGAARRADRLRRRFLRKNNTDYAVLVDGTRYMEEMTEETEKIEITPPTPGAILTIYLVFVGDAFSSLGEFIPNFEVMLARDADADSPMLGDINENALVLESIDEVGPATVVDFAGGVFTPNQVDLTQAGNMNPENAIWITNSSTDNLMLEVPGHPHLALPPDQEVAFNDLFDGQIIGMNGETTALNIVSGAAALACCVNGRCEDNFASAEECTGVGGTAFPGAFCIDDPCAPPPDLWEESLGAYTLQGNCPDNDQTVMLSHVNEQLVLQNLPENNDIPLICEGLFANGAGVTAFGVADHDLILMVRDTGLNLSLSQPMTGGFCTSDLVPVP